MKKLMVFNLALCALSLFCCGCVERTMQVKSDPPGALVFVNGDEKGRTPYIEHFDFYGTMEFRLEKDGYRTKTELVKVKPPIYQRFPLDFFFEVIWPFKIVDGHTFAFNLDKRTKAEPEKVVKRARKLKKELEEMK